MLLMLLVAWALASAVALAAPASARLVGDWQGSLDAGGQSLRLVLHVREKTGGGLEASFESPDQTTAAFPATVTLSGERVVFAAESIGGRLEATLAADGTLQGTWFQRGAELPLVMRRGAPTGVAPPRDEPRPPFPYQAVDVTYPSADGRVRISATLTVPPGQGPFPAVLLVAGSGPSNRDERIGRHRPFLLLADSLTRRGMVVLRADKRGIGRSTGDASTATIDDYAQDAAGGVDFLKRRSEVDPRRVGLLGHSEGGMVVPMVATTSRPADVAFVVLLAAPSVRGRDILLEQTRLIMAAEGIPREQIEKVTSVNSRLYDIVASTRDAAELRARLRKILEEAMAVPPGDTAPNAALEGQMRVLTSAWFRQFVTFDPAPALKALRCPVLALYGGLDLQVPPGQNQAPMEGALKAGHGTVELLPGLNHLFQHATRGLPSEYQRIDETFAPQALKRIGDWVVGVTSKNGKGSGRPCGPLGREDKRVASQNPLGHRCGPPLRIPASRFAERAGAAAHDSEVSPCRPARAWQRSSSS